MVSGTAIYEELKNKSSALFLTIYEHINYITSTNETVNEKQSLKSLHLSVNQQLIYT